MIWHIPEGLIPGRQSGFQRDPLYPAYGTDIRLEAAIDKEEGESSVGNLLIHFVNPEGHTVFTSEMILDESRSEHNDRCFYSAKIAAAIWDQASGYQFILEDNDHNQFVETRVYPCRRYAYSSLQTLNYQRDNSLIRYSMVSAEGSNYELVLDLLAKQIRFCQVREPHSGREQDNIAITASWQDDIRVIAEKEIVRWQNEAGKDLFVINIDGSSAVMEDERGLGVKVSLRFHGIGHTLYGCGEKFNRVNQAGLAGYSYIIEQFTEQDAVTYFPIPLFYSLSGWGIFSGNSACMTYESQVNVNEGTEAIALTLVQDLIEYPDHMDTWILDICFGSPRTQIANYHRLTGQAALPPNWVFRPWVSANNWDSQHVVDDVLAKSEQHDLPFGAIVLEAWSDEETFYRFNDAEIVANNGGIDDYVFQGRWPEPREMAAKIVEYDANLVLWQIPIMKPTSQGMSDLLKEDVAALTNNRYAVRTSEGAPATVADLWFKGSYLIDFTNPETCDWWFGKRRYLLNDLGVRGFKTDGGEFIYDWSLQFANGKSGQEEHNLYPVHYAQSYHRFMDQELGPGKGVTFSRAGYSGAQQYPLHWAGDQLSTFEELRAQLSAGLSLGLSGVPFWGFDYGGFAGELPGKELYLRALALACFSPVMQFHSEPSGGQFYKTLSDDVNNNRSPWNLAAYWDDPEIVAVYRTYVYLRENLLDYITSEAQAAVSDSRPLMAAVAFDWPHEPAAPEASEDTFMFGRDLLVAPIIEQGSSGRDVWLPPGEWMNAWTGEKHQGAQHLHVSFKGWKIPVFARASGRASAQILEAFADRKKSNIEE